MSFQGNPCWYELGTSDVDGAKAFYAGVLGWTVGDSEMEGFDYRLARSGKEMVAGLTPLDHQPEGTPPNWLIYFAVDDCDDMARKAEELGGKILTEPADIPGTGRFAILADPQGAVFGLLQPDMSQMSEADRKKAETTGAFDQKKPGHGNWHDLMSADPEAGFTFYSALFGWTRSQSLEMGEAGTYQIFAHKGQDIGGMMGLGQAPQSCWLVYFGTDGAEAAAERIKEAGGRVHHGPAEVPGGARIVQAADPQGAWFAVVGPK